MISSRVGRTLALAILLAATSGAGTAAAQTVVVRGIPAGSAAELVQGAATATATANANGDATLTGNLSDPGDSRVNLYVDVCENVRRVHITERDAVPPAPQDGCTRAPVAGVFVIRPISTIVVNLSGTNPAVLLRQGPYDLRPARKWEDSPTGLVVSGGGGFGKLHNAHASACGTVTECPGDDTGVAFTGGIAYWLTPYLGIEASYLKPAKTLFEGAANDGRFRSTFETHVLTFTGKVGVPAGPMRFYAQGGATYHRATASTIQDSADGIEDRFDLTTAGWGWTFGGGAEAWVAPRVALYAEGGRAVLKGGGVETRGEGSLDERLTYVVFGLRVSLRR